MTLRHPLRRLAIALFLILSGCTNYRYDVLGADGSAVPVAKDRDLIVPAAPANLRFRQVESRCVLMVENPTTQPIALDGAASTIVDPKGESLAIASQLIAPGSFTKFILPPYDERPRNDSGFQFGFGVIVDAQDRRPLNLLQINGPKQEFWNWDSAGEIKLILSLRQDDKPTRHEVVLRRTRQ